MPQINRNTTYNVGRCVGSAAYGAAKGSCPICGTIGVCMSVSCKVSTPIQQALPGACGALLTVTTGITAGLAAGACIFGIFKIGQKYIEHNLQYNFDNDDGLPPAQISINQGVKPRNYGSTASDSDVAIISLGTSASEVVDNNVLPKTIADKPVNEDEIFERYNLGL